MVWHSNPHTKYTRGLSLANTNGALLQLLAYFIEYYVRSWAPNPNNVMVKMEQILRVQLLAFVKQNKMVCVDEEGNSVKVKELLDVDVYDQKNLLSKREVFIGHRCPEIIKSQIFRLWVCSNLTM